MVASNKNIGTMTCTFQFKKYAMMAADIKAIKAVKNQPPITFKTPATL